MNIDLSSILSAINGQNATIGDTVNQIAQNNVKQQELREGMTDGIMRDAALNAVEIETKGLGELRAQENARKAATAFGTNMDMSDEIVTALGMRMRDATMKSMEAQDRINAKEQVGLLDNPIEFIMNQLSVGSDYNAYNAAAETFNQASNALAGINQATQQTAVTQNAIAQTVTEASIAARIEKTKVAAGILSAENKIKSFAENQDSLVKVVQLEGQQLQNHLAARQVYQDDRNFAMRQQEFASSQKAQAVNLARMEKDLAKDALEEQDQVMIATAINVARGQMGLNSVEPREVNRILKLGGQVSEDLRSQYLIGASSMATGKAIIATNPAEALTILNRNKGKLKSSTMTEFIRDLPALAQKANPASFQTLKPAEQAQQINIIAIREAERQASEIKKGDDSNIYALPPTATIMEAAGLANSELYNKVLKPVLDTQQNKTIDPARIIDLAAAAISAKSVRIKTIASELDTFFAQAKQINNDFNNYEQIGLPPQIAVNVKLDEGLLNSPVRDVSDPAKLNGYLMKKTNPMFKLQQGLMDSGTLQGAIRLMGKFPAPEPKE